MTNVDTFNLNLVFVTPDRVPSSEQAFWRANRPEADVLIFALPDGRLRFEVYPASGDPTLKMVAPELKRGCHWLLNVRHQSGKTRIKLAEIGYGEQAGRAESLYDYDRARENIAHLFGKE